MKRRRALLFSLTMVLVLCAACGLWLHRERQQYALNHQLIEALEHGDTKQALALVNTGADPNTRYKAFPAPSLKLLFNRLLRNKGWQADNAPTALMIVCGSNGTEGDLPTFPFIGDDANLPLIQAMVAHGANVNAKTIFHLTALPFAVSQYRLHTVKLLLQHGADVNAQDDRHATPLMMITPSAPLDMLPLLLSYGANPNAQDADGNTLLHQAVLWPNASKVVPELLVNGAKPNIKNQNGDTPLQLAQQNKHPDIVRLLQQYGAK